MSPLVAWVACILIWLITVYLLHLRTKPAQITAGVLYGFIIIPWLILITLNQKSGMNNFLWTMFSTVTAFSGGLALARQKPSTIHMYGLGMCLLGVGLLVFK
jgi:hypothetical protein